MKEFTNPVYKPLSIYYKDAVQWFSKKGLWFCYLEPDDFDDYCEDYPETRVTGNVKLHKRYKNRDDGATLLLPKRRKDAFDEERFKAFNIYDPDDKKCLGYVKVEDNAFLRVEKRRFPFIILILLGILAGLALILRSCVGGGNPLLPKEPGEDIKEPTKLDEPIATGQIEIPGYASIVLSAEQPEMFLINPQKNTVYFEYIISEGDKVLFDSDLILPGKMVRANLYSKLGKGKHTLLLSINTYDITDESPCNGSTQRVNLLVE